MSTVLEQAIGLSVEEKLKLIDDLWDSMSKDPEKIPVADWQRAELTRRLESQRQNPQPGQIWEEVEREIRNGKE